MQGFFRFRPVAHRNGSRASNLSGFAQPLTQKDCPNEPPPSRSGELHPRSRCYETFVVGDACGGLTVQSHDLALRWMQTAGVQMTSWVQLLLELQRDWTRHETYGGARAIVEEFAGGYGIGLAYARDMIKP